MNFVEFIILTSIIVFSNMRYVLNENINVSKNLLCTEILKIKGGKIHGDENN